jgi:ribose-phosphate pyrophosphokinase
MKPILFAMPGNEGLTGQVGVALNWPIGRLQVHHFPDGESNPRFLDEVNGHQIVIVCTLDQPDTRIMALYLAAKVARELGATRIGLVAPYLAYMRQDARFHHGEGITSVHFAQLISNCFDWMVTVDPHLHRHHALSDIYTIPAVAVQAAPAISRWIAANVANPVVIGPDAESEQWASEVANAAKCPYTVLQKVRHGDRNVELSVPDSSRWQGMTPVLVDDIASTARTMIAATGHLHAAGLPATVCIVVHALFVDDAYIALQDAGVNRIVSCNTVDHPSNNIDVCTQLVTALQQFAQFTDAN